jgi:hypothetical protein
MAQVNPENITAMPVVQSRRRFLSQAAGVAAGGTVLARARIAPGPLTAAPASPLGLANASAVSADPIFAAIEAHKAAVVALYAQLSARSKLEIELPRDKRGSTVDAWGEEIVATDDPRWIECERAVGLSFDAETDAACALLGDRPTTIAGALALLHYATAADVDGELWPRELQSDDGHKTRPWHYFLIEALAEVLPGMVSS